MRSHLTSAAAVLALTAAVLAVFGPTVGFDFVNFDDPVFVLNNQHVAGGITREGLRWAFSANGRSSYHPLTWVSYMVDRELFGLDPAGYHAHNVALHLGAVLLLFWALRAATGSLGASFAVALLWAVHPLRAESVAWVGERKDVLSACLAMACLRAHVWYARRPSPARYLTVLALFALGLSAKPMLVSWPLVLLLLDAWPLRRLPLPGPVGPDTGFPRVGWRLALAEKAPFVLLATLSAALTMVVVQQSTTLQSVASYPLGVRVANALAGMWWYVEKLVLPTDLAVFHPFDRVPGPGVAALLALGIGAATAGAVLAWRRRPWLAVGWGWFLIMLVPVVGLVQVGSQRVADRYSYLPHAGLLLAAVWLGREATRALPRAVHVAAVALPAAVLAALGSAQVSTFRDSVTLFSHALEVTDNNYVAHTNLAQALLAQGMVAQAENHYREAIRILPQWETPHFGLGSVLARQGRLREAAAAYERGLKTAPQVGAAHRELGMILLRLGREQEGVAHLREASRIEAAEPLPAPDPRGLAGAGS